MQAEDSEAISLKFTERYAVNPIALGSNVHWSVLRQNVTSKAWRSVSRKD